MAEFAIVIGDEAMAIYRDDELAVAATKLTFGDVLEACGISCDIWEGDLEVYNDPTKFPKQFKEVKMEPGLPV